MAISAPFVRNPYNYDTSKAGDESALKCLDPSLADDSQREESDINTIVRRFGLLGELPQGLHAPTYDDFVGVKDFKSAMDVIARSRESFEELPAEVRYRFKNDPQAFVEFCSLEANRPEAEKLGLVFPKPVPPPPAPVPPKV